MTTGLNIKSRFCLEGKFMNINWYPGHMKKTIDSIKRT